MTALRPSEVATTLQRIGGLFAGAGIVGSLALINGTSAILAAAAFVGAAWATMPEGRVPRVSRAFFALVFALYAVAAFMGSSPMWLWTLIIIALLLGLASLASGWPRKAKAPASDPPSL